MMVAPDGTRRWQGVACPAEPTLVGGVERTSTSVQEEMALLANGSPYRHFFDHLNSSLVSYFEPPRISSPPALLPWLQGAVPPNSLYPGAKGERRGPGKSGTDLVAPPHSVRES